MAASDIFKPVDDILNRLTTDRNGLPGAAVLALDGKGSTIFERYAGRTSLNDDAKPMARDSVFWLASCTKFITSIAALQCVERGLLSLDEPVGTVLLEYEHPQILKGYDDDDRPILELARRTMTLRHLLTHSSGLSYDIFGPELREWSRKTCRTVNQQSGKLEGMRYPLLFEPGLGWTYGAGVDWAGQMVERVTGSSSLEEYFQTNIFGPLDLRDISCKVSSKGRMLEQRVELASRKPDGTLKAMSHIPRDQNAEFCAGGSALYSTAANFVRIVAEVAGGGGVLLKRETVDEMFRPQLPDTQYLDEALRKSCAGVALNISPNFTDSKMRIQHGLSFLINLDELPTGRPRGSGQYGGAANTFWWADRETGVAAVVLTQLTPYGDAKVMELYETFEKALYTHLQSCSKDER